ncbi:hypothetical protein [Rhizobium sp. R693]|uniref:hypothetical protein n=1 Tax=Rhizobium sp. R693 TaxID=1764276 RepID=UPI001132566F|nr:hypothetical protein [Rhizobium sp. R693]
MQAACGATRDKNEISRVETFPHRHVFNCGDHVLLGYRGDERRSRLHCHTEWTRNFRLYRLAARHFVESEMAAAEVRLIEKSPDEVCVGERG